MSYWCPTVQALMRDVIIWCLCGGGLAMCQHVYPSINQRCDNLMFVRWRTCKILPHFGAQFSFFAVLHRSGHLYVELHVWKLDNGLGTMPLSESVWRAKLEYVIRWSEHFLFRITKDREPYILFWCTAKHSFFGIFEDRIRF